MLFVHVSRATSLVGTALGDVVDGVRLGGKIPARIDRPGTAGAEIDTHIRDIDSTPFEHGFGLRIGIGGS